MRFRFRLESILRLKIHEEEGAREELVAIRREIAREEDRVKNLKKRLMDFEREFVEALEKGMSGAELRLRLDGRRSIEVEIERAEKRLDDLRDMERKAFENYLERRKERKALEKLKERRFRKFLEEIDNRERKAIDEMAERKHWWGST